MMSRQEVVDAAVWAVTRAQASTSTTSSSPPRTRRAATPTTWSRSSREVIEAGARDDQRPRHHRLRAARGVRRALPHLRERVPGGDRVIWSAHCHNDLGMAVANSLAAVQNGARQVECTVNGIGERAGNTSMEEVVMAIKTRGERLRRRHRRRHRADLPDQPPACRRSPASRCRSTRPIVGENAFAHEAGIHQDGVLKYRQNYEIMDPESDRAGVEPAGARQALGASRASSARLRELGLDTHRRRHEQGLRRASRRSPTRRRPSTTRT